MEFRVNIISTGHLVQTDLQARIDGKASSCRVHTSNILAVMHLLQTKLCSVIPVIVVQVLPDQGVRLHCAVCVNLNKYNIA